MQTQAPPVAWNSYNELLIASWGQASDKHDLIDKQSGELVIVCREPHLTLPSKWFRSMGGSYARMAGFAYEFIDAQTNQVLLRISRKSHIVGRPDITFHDGKGAYIGTLKRAFSVSSKQLKFVTNEKETLFKVQLVKQAGIVMSSVGIGYEVLVNDDVLASTKKDKDKRWKHLKGKRRRLKLEPSLAPDDILRLLVLGMAVGSVRIDEAT